MKVTKFDIGAEIISIITKGMYPDPRDAVREYIQNAIDAKSENVDVKVRQNSVIVEDDGQGMDFDTLRKAIRIGISDKNPKKDVGFMGIGIYSAFHLCDTLTIYTKKKDLFPLRLEMNFKSMRDFIAAQREQRFNEQITSDELWDLQTLMEEHIALSDERAIQEDEFPVICGTRVELFGLNKELDDMLADFKSLSTYLRDVIPLHFNKDKFEWAEQIENKVNEICASHGAAFEVVNLKLQVNNQTEYLYRPYIDASFTDSKSQPPIFKEIKKDNKFFGVAWGCLNSARKKIENKDVRGFIIKKQGFSIGKRENVVKYFNNANTFFDRYIGEIIIVNSELLPNAARNEIEYSSLKVLFEDTLKTKVASYFIAEANKFQEYDIADEQISDNAIQLKSLLGKFSPYLDNTDVLLNLIADTNKVYSNISKKKNKVRPEKQDEAQAILEAAKDLENQIRSTLYQLVSEKRKREKEENKKSAVTINETNRINVARSVAEYKSEDLKKYQSLIDLLKDLEQDLSPDLEKVLNLIDEKFIQRTSKSREDYYSLLNELKEEIYSQVLDQ